MLLLLKLLPPPPPPLPWIALAVKPRAKALPPRARLPPVTADAESARSGFAAMVDEGRKDDDDGGGGDRWLNMDA